MIMGPEYAARPILPVRTDHHELGHTINKNHKRYSAEVIKGRSVSSHQHLRSPNEPIYRDESGMPHDQTHKRTFSLRKAESSELDNLEAWNKWCADTDNLYPTPTATPLGPGFAGGMNLTEAQKALKDRRRQSWYNSNSSGTSCSLGQSTTESQFGSTHKRETFITERSDESINRGDYSSDITRRDDARTDTPTEHSLESESDRDAFPTPRHLRNISDFEFGRKAFNRLSTGSLQSCSGSEDAFTDVFGTRLSDFGPTHNSISEAGPRKLWSERPLYSTPSQPAYRNHRRQGSRFSSQAEPLPYLDHSSKIEGINCLSPLLSPPIDGSHIVEAGKRSSTMRGLCVESPLSPSQQTTRVESWYHLQDVFGMLAQKEREVLEAKQNLEDAQESLKNFRLKLNTMLGTQPTLSGLCIQPIVVIPRIMPGVGVNCLHYVRIVPEAASSPWQIEDDGDGCESNDSKSLGYIVISKLLYVMRCVLHTTPTRVPITIVWEPNYPSATMTLYRGLILTK